MSGAVQLSPPPKLDGDCLLALRAFLQSISYTEASCNEWLQSGEVYRLDEAVSNALKETAPAGALHAAIKLFLLNQVVERSSLNKIFRGVSLELMLTLGLVRDQGEVVEPCFSIFPCGDLLILTDLRIRRLAHEQVMPLSFESYWLARTMYQVRATYLLDLCTGSGIHALTGAANASSVDAIDNNPRAIEFVKANSLFNGLGNIHPQVGDLYSSVRHGHTYDLIVAQPPYALESESPGGANYWSGGESGEEVLARLIAGLPAVLSTNGRALIMSLIVLRNAEDLEAKFRNWLGPEGRQFDIVLWTRPSQLLQLAHKGAEHDASWREKLARWRAVGIRGFWLAVIELRWSETPLFRIQQDQWAYQRIAPGLRSVVSVWAAPGAQPPADSEFMQ